MLKVGDMALNTKTRTLYCNGDTIALTRIEASVHRSNIMAKLGVHNSAELVRYVMQHNLLDLDSNVSNSGESSSCT
jgi:DNA-binding response OmpR family regulator